MGLGGVYLAGVGLLGLILAAEQVVVRIRLANVPMAFFTLNGVFSILYLAAVVAGLWQTNHV